MRYLTIIIAYSMLALIFGLAFLLPERPASYVGIIILTSILTIVVAIFDLIGQRIIDSRWFVGSPMPIRAFIGLTVFALFLGVVYKIVEFVGLETIPW